MHTSKDAFSGFSQVPELNRRPEIMRRVNFLVKKSNGLVEYSMACWVTIEYRRFSCDITELPLLVAKTTICRSKMVCSCCVVGCTNHAVNMSRLRFQDPDHRRRWIAAEDRKN